MERIKLKHYFEKNFNAISSSDFESYLEQGDIYNVDIFCDYFVDENAKKVYVFDDNNKLILAPKHDYNAYLKALKNCSCFCGYTGEQLDDDVFEVDEVFAEFQFGGLFLEGHEFDTESHDTHFGYYEDEFTREYKNDLKNELKRK